MTARIPRPDGEPVVGLCSGCFERKRRPMWRGDAGFCAACAPAVEPLSFAEHVDVGRVRPVHVSQTHIPTVLYIGETGSSLHRATIRGTARLESGEAVWKITGAERVRIVGGEIVR